MAKLIILDAGHGINTPGKRCLKSIDPNETREWALNSRIADKVAAILDDYYVDVARVDDPDGVVDVPLEKRTDLANKLNADIYVSIHHNAGAKGSASGGTVVYHYSPHPEIAQKLYNCVVRLTGLIGNRSQTVIKNDFWVLRKTKMEAVLIENGFMDSTTDTPIILTENHAAKTAQGIADFLISQLNLEPKKPKNYKYNVVLGPYDNEDYAEAVAEDLQNQNKYGDVKIALDLTN